MTGIRTAKTRTTHTTEFLFRTYLSLSPTKYCEVHTVTVWKLFDTSATWINSPVWNFFVFARRYTTEITQFCWPNKRHEVEHSYISKAGNTPFGKYQLKLFNEDKISKQIPNPNFPQQHNNREEIHWWCLISNVLLRIDQTMIVNP